MAVAPSASIMARARHRGAHMPIVNRIADFHADLAAWRHEIHAHPETAFEEKRTADFVASRLQDFGIEVHRGLAGTGVVGTLRGTRPGGRGERGRRPRDGGAGAVREIPRRGSLWHA